MTKESEGKLELPNKKYRTIVVDYPWKITPISESISKKFHSPLAKGLPYNTMTDTEILDFPILDLADTNCDFFIWTTHSKLPFTFKLMEHLGLKYHCLMTWDKQEGINCWGFTRNSEFVLYCYKGKMGVRLDSKKNMPTVFREKRTSHSKKPRTFYDMIIKGTHEPRIDLFARNIRHGFDTWGNDSKLTHKPLEAFAQ